MRAGREPPVREHGLFRVGAAADDVGSPGGLLERSDDPGLGMGPGERLGVLRVARGDADVVELEQLRERVEVRPALHPRSKDRERPSAVASERTGGHRGGRPGPDRGGSPCRPSRTAASRSRRRTARSAPGARGALDRDCRGRPRPAWPRASRAGTPASSRGSRRGFGRPCAAGRRCSPRSGRGARARARRTAPGDRSGSGRRRRSAAAEAPSVRMIEARVRTTGRIGRAVPRARPSGLGAG